MNIDFLADHVECIPQIASWYFNEWGHKESNNSLERTCERLKAKLYKDHAPICIIATADEKLIGVAQLKIREMEIFPAREFWLGGVYVDSTGRGQGIGELLVKRIEEISENLGIQELFLQTKKLDGGLYSKLGWKPIERITNNGITACIMHKQLHVKPLR